MKNRNLKKAASSLRRLFLCGLLCAAVTWSSAVLASCSQKKDGEDSKDGDKKQSEQVTNPETDAPSNVTEPSQTTEPPQTTAPETDAPKGTDEDTTAPGDDHVPEQPANPTEDNKPEDNPETDGTPTELTPVGGENTDGTSGADSTSGSDAENPDIVTDPSASGALTELAGAKDSGRFESKQSKTLKLLVDWEYEILDDGMAEVTVKVGVSHYRISAREKVDWGAIQVDGNAVLFTTPAFERRENTYAYTPFYTAVYKTDKSSMEIEASWKVLGTYSGQEIDTLTTEGTITFGVVDE